MFRSLRSRLIVSFVLIVCITLGAAGLALFARLGGYHDQLTASTLRSVAGPVYYNVSIAPGSVARQAGGAQQFRNELNAYLRQASQDTGVIVLLVDDEGRVVGAGTHEELAGETFPVPPVPERGPNFDELPTHTHSVQNGDTLLYVAVPMPGVVRVRPGGVAAVIVALPQATGRQVFRELLPRLLFAGAIGLVAALLAAFVLWAWMYRPLGRVTSGIRAVARGDYRQRVAVAGPTEVRALAHDVNSMADSVQTSQRALRDFLANVSHELKTPLTSIRGFSQAMLDGTLDTEEERARAARVIDFESRRLLHLVGELLDLSRIESGQQAMSLAGVRAAELLAHVDDVFSMRAEEEGVTLDVGTPTGADADAVVVADFDRIEQVLGNLLDNAFRHTPRGGHIEAGVRRTERGFVEFYVTDSGDGIAAEEMPHVFDRFYRSSGEKPGTGAGLGLTISREIVRAHGGEIRVEPAGGGGTTFAFTLPAGTGRTPPPRDAQGRPTRMTPRGVGEAGG